MKIVKVKPEMLFLILAIITGIALCLITPIGAGFDEDAHLARVWEISSFHFIPNEILKNGPGYPSAFFDISYRQKFFLKPVENNFFQQHITDKVNPNSMKTKLTYSVYSPVLYFPQAIVVGLLGRVFNAPVLVILYLCRFSILAIYILLSYLAIKIIPYGKWVLTLLALAPMALIQGSIISPDALSNGGSFLFIAWILWAASDELVEFKKREVVTLFLLVALLFSLKVNCVILALLFFLINPKKFGSKKKYFFTLAFISILFLILVAGWNLIASSQFNVVTSDPNVRPPKQFLYILFQPISYLQTLSNFIGSTWLYYYKEWIGVFGYRYWGFPEISYLLFTILLLVVFLFDIPNKPNGKKHRLILLGTFIIGTIFSITILYITMNPVGSNQINFFQGRYLIPIMPLFFFGILREKSSPVFLKYLKPIFISGLVMLSAILISTCYLAYHIQCGPQFYSTGYCDNPVYKNWSPNDKFSEPITNGITYEQSFNADCNKMEAIKLWADSHNVISGSTNFVIKDDKTGEILFDKTLDNNQIPSKKWLTLNIARINNSNGRQYSIKITSIDSDMSNGILIAISPRKEFSEGNFDINGFTQDYDLIFQYRCAIGIMSQRQYSQ
jgi:uncharacterized membrane protein